MAISKSDLSFAIVGFGSAGKMALETLSGLAPNARFLIVSGHKEEARQASFTRHISDVLNFSPDAVLVTGPASDRLDVIANLHGVSVPLFIEKPLAGTLQDAHSILTQLRVGTNACQLGYNLRFSTSLEFFRDYLQQERKGKVKRFVAETGQYLPDWRPDRDYRETVSARSDRGGGVLLELSHEIDYLRWIFGEVDWVRATLLRQSELEIDVEDTVHLTIGFEKSISGKQLIANLNMDFIRHDPTRSCTVIGDKGSLRWDGISGEVSLFQAGEKIWKTLFANDNGIEDTYILEWQELIEAIEEKRSPVVTGEDGLRVIEIIEAARLSAESGIQTAVIRSPIKNEASK